jgi:hypothetical protein
MTLTPGRYPSLLCISREGEVTPQFLEQIVVAFRYAGLFVAVGIDEVGVKLEFDEL